MNKNWLYQVLGALVLTILLLGVSRMVSSRVPRTHTVSSSAGLKISHTTVTESREKMTKEVVVFLSPRQSVGATANLHLHFPSGQHDVVVMEPRGNSSWVADLPPRPKGERIRYRVEVITDEQRVLLPPADQEGYLVKYKGMVSPALLLSHLVMLFGSLFFAVMAFFTAIDLLKRKPVAKRMAIYVILTFVTAFIGGIVVGVQVTRQVFGEGWGGWPVGTDVTDTKTEAMLLVWLVALVVALRSWGLTPDAKVARTAARLTIISFIVMLAAFLIPHSI